MNPKDKSITKEEAKKLLMKGGNQNEDVNRTQEIADFEIEKAKQDNVWMTADSSSTFKNLK